MNSNQPQQTRWSSGTVTVAKVRSHPDMYVVEHGDGFHNITASYDYMMQNYPPNKYEVPVVPRVGERLKSNKFEGVKSVTDVQHDLDSKDITIYAK